jgi:hypothetical protein
MRINPLSAMVFWLVFSSVPAFACKCVSPPPDAKTARAVAQWHAQRSDAIFEGTVQGVELKWRLIQAPVGGLVSTNLEEDPPVIQVTFNVSRSYKGVRANRVVLTTGLGGGDCGFDFQMGQQYLVYSYKDDSGQLSTGICSGTGLVQQSQSDLSFLRGEPSDSDTVKQNASSSTTKLCGHVVSSGAELADGQLFLFRVGNKSPIPIEDAEVADDGSFCFTGTSSGSYRLAFMRRAEESPVSFVWYPGTDNLSESDSVEMKDSRSRLGLTFKIPFQRTFSVRGNVLTSNKLVLPPQSEVLLMNADPSSFLVAYSQDVDTRGFFSFPSVLPGRYWALVGVDSDAATNWATKKIEVEVRGPVGSLPLELIPK